jgi:hypothetical protein
LNLIWDHVSSGLDGRESAYELLANGGVPAWRMRLRGWFKDYDRLANGVLQNLDVEMPHIDVAGMAQPIRPQAGVLGAPAASSAGISAPGRPGEWVGPPARG